MVSRGEEGQPPHEEDVLPERSQAEDGHVAKSGGDSLSEDFGEDTQSLDSFETAASQLSSQ